MKNVHVTNKDIACDKLRNYIFTNNEIYNYGGYTLP